MTIFAIIIAGAMTTLGLFPAFTAVNMTTWATITLITWAAALVIGGFEFYIKRSLLGDNSRKNKALKRSKAYDKDVNAAVKSGRKTVKAEDKYKNNTIK